MKTIDLTGKRFAMLTVTGISQEKTSAGAKWECVCDCGNKSAVVSLKLRKGLSKSCGCYRSIFSSTINIKHGLSNKSRTYKTWKEMRNRCNNPNADNYKWYGGRGVKIAKEWGDYVVFLSDMGERPEGKTLDRIDSDGDYCPENCKWSTPKEQAITNRGCFKKRVASK
jgi:hypothetical protein